MEVVTEDAPRWARVHGRLVELDEVRERLGALAAADGAGSGAAAAILEQLDASIVRLEETVAAYESGRRQLLERLARLAA